VLWALGEMVRTTHDASLTAQLSAQIAAHDPEPVTWMTPELFGYAAVMLDPEGDPALASAASAKLSGLCDRLASTAGSTGYGVATASTEYWWESNESLLGRTQALLFGYTVTGKPSYRQVALGQLHWLLGDNGLGQSFVTGHGSTPVTAPYHWTYYALHHLVPGWATGGPNHDPTGADPLLKILILQGTPPAKCYVDRCTAIGSFASNEGETSENAALVFVTGFFAADTVTGDAGTPGGPAPASHGCACSAEGEARRGEAGLGAASFALLALRRRRRRATARRRALAALDVP
jgi:endoglucanase